MNLSSHPGSHPRLAIRLADPSLATSLARFVRSRVPEAEVDDIVQATLSDALQAEAPPIEDEDIVRWVFGICRHKIVDWFRRVKREIPRDLEGDDSAAAESAPTGAMDLMRWARKELPEGKEHEQTLEWMLREGEGEKLENIAAEANLPAPRVRQRVSRLRRHFKARWAAQAAAVAALLLVGLAIFLALRGKKEEFAPRPEPSFEPSSLPLPPPSAPPAPAQLMPAGSADVPDAAVPSVTAVPTASAAPPPRPTGVPTNIFAPSKPQQRGKSGPTKPGPVQSSNDSLGSSDVKGGGSFSRGPGSTGLPDDVPAASPTPAASTTK